MIPQQNLNSEDTILNISRPQAVGIVALLAGATVATPIIMGACLNYRLRVLDYIEAPTIEHTPNKGETISHWAAEEGIPNGHLEEFTEAIMSLNPQGVQLWRNGPKRPKVTDNGNIYAHVLYRIPDINRDRRVGVQGNYSQQQTNINHKQKGPQYQRR
jgi:hypothetical protein